MVQLLRQLGLQFLRCEGYSDYYAGVRGYSGGVARGRAIACNYFDARKLGPWQKKLRVSFTGGIVVFTHESSRAQLVIRTTEGAAMVAKIIGRTIAGRLKGEMRLTNGAALIAPLLDELVARSVPVWTGTKLSELVLENGEVVGAVLDRRGKKVRVRARGGVLLSGWLLAQRSHAGEVFRRPAQQRGVVAGQPGRHRRCDRDRHQPRGGDRAHGRSVVDSHGHSTKRCVCLRAR